MQEHLEHKVIDFTKSLKNEINDYFFFPGTNKDDIQLWARNLATTIHEVTDKPKLVHALEAMFSEAKNADNELTNHRILLLKNQIIAIAGLPSSDEDSFASSDDADRSFSQEPYHHWKDAIYGIKQIPLMGSFFTQTFFNPNAKNPIAFTSERFATTTTRCQDYVTIVGSTFATNDKHRLATETTNRNNGSGSHNLDASYTAATKDGFVIAIADGLGGHLNDSKQDETIGQTSKTVAKEAARFMAATYTPRISFKFIKQMIHEEVAIKTPKKKEAAAISCGRAIKTEDGFLFIGFSVGDTMLIAYEPKEKRFIQVVPGRQLVQGFGDGPAYLPNKNNNALDVLFFDKQLSKDAIVLGLSDGVYDHLPTKEEHFDTKKGELLPVDHKESSYYSNTSIDFEILHDYLDEQIQAPSEVTAFTLTNLIANIAINRAEKERLHRTEKAKERKKQIKAEVDEFSLHQYQADKQATVTMGDDFTIAALQLSATDFSYNLVKDRNIADLKFVDSSYSTKEILSSIATLGLYAIIRDTLGYQHQAYSNKQILLCTLGVLAFFLTGTVFGLCYLSFKLGCAVSEVLSNAMTQNKQIPELVKVEGHQGSEDIEMDDVEEFSVSSSSVLK